MSPTYADDHKETSPSTWTEDHALMSMIEKTARFILNYEDDSLVHCLVCSIPTIIRSRVFSACLVSRRKGSPAVSKRSEVAYGRTRLEAMRVLYVRLEKVQREILEREVIGGLC